MDNLGMVLLETLLAVSFILLTVQKRNGLWLFTAVAFVLAAGFVRYLIPVDAVRDFAPYLSSFSAVKYGSIPTELLFEPYRLVLFKSVLLLNGLDDPAQIAIVYYFHFTVVTGFFLWLAYMREVTFEAKVILFLAFYPTMAFVWIRSGMGYVAACYLFFAFTTGRRRLLHYALPAIHASVIPLLVAIKVKDLNPFRKTLVIFASVVVGYFILESSYVQYIVYKLDRYSETSDLRTSTDLLLFHAANILVFIYLAIINSKFRKNFVVLVLMGAYLASFVLNPVVGLRVFPLVLIASIVQRISFPRYQHLTLWICAAYLPIYFARFEQILL